MNAPSSDYRAVLDFWFRETAPQQWFARSDAFDGIIRQRFFAVWQRAAQGELADWRGNMQGSSRSNCIFHPVGQKYQNSNQAVWIPFSAK